MIQSSFLSASIKGGDHQEYSIFFACGVVLGFLWGFSLPVLLRQLHGRGVQGVE
jgi:hypothetical protein